MIPNHLPSTNSGIVNLGGQNHNSNVVGDGAHVDNRRIAPTPSAPAEGIENPKGSRHADVGVVTILPEEMRAVVDRFGLKRSERRDGLFFNTGTVETESGPLSVVAARTHSPGQRSTMSTLDHLRHHYSPRLWLLVGIGGGLDPVDARVGNVIVSTRIVYYDSRKIKADDVQRRGEERETPARMVHAVNAYFTDHGSPAGIRGQIDGHRKRTFEVLHGLVGSGEAVIADRNADERRYLKHYNDKVLAVDMESGGLSQYWQENSVSSSPNPGWVVVRGISDNADQEKNDDHHELAAFNAAHVARELLPYLC